MFLSDLGGLGFKVAPEFLIYGEYRRPVTPRPSSSVSSRASCLGLAPQAAEVFANVAKALVGELIIKERLQGFGQRDGYGGYTGSSPFDRFTPPSYLAILTISIDKRRLRPGLAVVL